MKTKKKVFFSPRDAALKNLVKLAATKYQIKIFRFALNWTHMHFVFQTPSRKAYVNFVRYLTSQVVRHLAKRHKIKLKGVFLLRPFTRIVAWGRDFAGVCEYVLKNIGQSFNHGDEMITLNLKDWRAGPIGRRAESVILQTLTSHPN